MQHMVNKAHTRWVAAIMISGHLAHAGNHRRGSAGHRQGQCSAQYAVVCEKPMAFGQGVVVTVKQVTTLPWHFTPKGALFGPIYGIYVG